MINSKCAESCAKTSNTVDSRFFELPWEMQMLSSNYRG